MRHFIVYTFMIEVVPLSKKGIISSWLFFIDGFVPIITALLILLFKNTVVLVLIGLIMNLTALIILVIVRP